MDCTPEMDIRFGIGFSNASITRKEGTVNRADNANARDARPGRSIEEGRMSTFQNHG
jgi:hypothetical protein